MLLGWDIADFSQHALLKKGIDPEACNFLKPGVAIEGIDSLEHGLTMAGRKDTAELDPKLSARMAAVFARLSGKTRRIRARRRLGDRAMARQEWQEAANHYRCVIDIEPLPTIVVQYGHALKESGRLEDAEAAYASVPASAAEAPDAWFHRAEILSHLERRAEAIELYADVLHMLPSHRGAFAGLIHLGARDRLPETFVRWALPDASAALASGVERLRQQFDHWADVAIYPLSAYDQFRHNHPILAPPAASGRAIHVVIDARDAGAYFIRATLLSLVDQVDTNWTTTVLTTELLADHSVASLAGVDPRIVFVTEAEMIDARSDLMLHISAGSILSPHSVGWFRFVTERTSSAACWCDHDHAAEAWNGTLRYSEPRLWGVFDADMIAQTASPPIAVLIDTSRVPLPPLAEEAQEWRRTALLRAARTTSQVVHIPRILTTALRLPERAVGAPNDIDSIALWSIEPAASPPRSGPIEGSELSIEQRDRRPAVTIHDKTADVGLIQLVIQTRDSTDILSEAVETLLANAAEPDRIELVVVDNRSMDAETLRYLDELSHNPNVQILPVDEPFNWARANNLAANLSRSDIIVFANNDITMLTPGWDRLLRGYLGRSDTGAVGARLLYPDGTIQHGGVVFGIGDGGPLHEGVKLPASEAGHLDRLDLTRSVAAVTGAFLAARRDVFERVGGFDALHFPIAYNDVDFCLAIRATGARILYAPAIELIHHESKTRGLNIGRARVAWDMGEFTSLRQKWPADWCRDPGINIQWSSDRIFEGFRDPGLRTILQSIDQSASFNPWLTTPKGL